MALRLVDGINTDRDAFALEVINKVGPGGHYLAEKHTLNWLEKEHIMPSDVIDRLTLEAERKQGPKDMISKAREAVDKRLKEHVPEPLQTDVENDLRNALKDIMNRYKVKSLPIV